jgi:hypothetical protein
MAAILAANVTIVISEVRLMGRKRRVQGTLAFGDGALTYSTAGIPMPAISSFGFYREMNELKIFGVNARTTEYLPSWVKATNTLQLWVSHDTAGVTTLPMDEAPAAAAPAARTYDFEAWGW